MPPEGPPPPPPKKSSPDSSADELSPAEERANHLRYVHQMEKPIKTYFGEQYVERLRNNGEVIKDVQRVRLNALQNEPGSSQQKAERARNYLDAWGNFVKAIDVKTGAGITSEEYGTSLGEVETALKGVTALLRAGDTSVVDADPKHKVNAQALLDRLKTVSGVKC